jgi:hypothetical protein
MMNHHLSVLNSASGIQVNQNRSGRPITYRDMMKPAALHATAASV